MYDKTPRPPDITLGETDFRDRHQRFGMYTVDRLRHVWVIGKTGSGKSTLLLNLIAQDLAAGRGVGVLDPHGDLARAVLELVPKSRTNDVAYVDPADKTHALSFNVLRQGGVDTEASLTATGLIAVFKKHWGDVWGPRLEHVLRNAILAVLPDSRASLLFMYRFLTDDRMRAKMAPRIEDPVVGHRTRKPPMPASPPSPAARPTPSRPIPSVQARVCAAGSPRSTYRTARNRANCRPANALVPRSAVGPLAGLAVRVWPAAQMPASPSGSFQNGGSRSSSTGGSTASATSVS